MQHYTAERIIKTKYKRAKVVNYRQQNDNPNTSETCTFLDCDQYRMNHDRHINIIRQKRALGIQYKHESKEDITGFIPKPVARPEYGTIYQHKGIARFFCLFLWLCILHCVVLGNVARGALGTVQGLTFYCSKDN